MEAGATAPASSFSRNGKTNGSQGPTKRKSSNLLGSLGRASTLSDRHDKPKDAAAAFGSDSAFGGSGGGIGAGPSDFGRYGSLPSSSTASLDPPYSPAPPTPTLSQQGPPNSSTSSSSLPPGSQPLGTPSQSLAGAFENAKQALAKRLETWKYLKSVHQGHQTLWFQTVALTRADLEHHLSQGGSNAAVASLQKRTVRFMLLGLNMSPVVDLPSSTELLKALLHISQEFEQLSDDSLTRPRMRAIFRPASRIARARSGTMSTPEAFMASDDAGSSLYCPNIPFDLDYFQTFFTLADIFVEVYSKLLSSLGGGGHGSGPPPMPPPPSSSTQYARSGSTAGLPLGTSNSLNVPSASSALGSGLSPNASAPALTPAMLDMLTKIDARLKKILSTILKELDALARQSIKDELAGLDAALGNLGVQPPPELLRRPTGLED